MLVATRSTGDVVWGRQLVQIRSTSEEYAVRSHRSQCPTRPTARGGFLVPQDMCQPFYWKTRDLRGECVGFERSPGRWSVVGACGKRQRLYIVVVSCSD